MRVKYILCFLALAVVPFSAHADEPIEALRKGVDEGLSILQGPRMNDQDGKEVEQQKLRLILEQLFDFHEFSRRVLASNWKKFSDI
jgi:ABC-type transporter MlaC component